MAEGIQTWKWRNQDSGRRKCAEEQAAQIPESMERPEGMGGSNEKPLVDTLLSQDALLAQYESYLAEIAETYFTESYMSQIVSETAEMIAPYDGKRRYRILYL